MRRPRWPRTAAASAAGFPRRGVRGGAGHRGGAEHHRAFAIGEREERRADPRADGMADLRTDALKKQAEDRKTIEELGELLFKQNQREIKSMKEALDFGPRPAAAAAAGTPRPSPASPSRNSWLCWLSARA